MNHEKIKFHLSQMVCALLSIDDPVELEGSIYATLCVLKEQCGEHFENALIYLLKKGIEL